MFGVHGGLERTDFLTVSTLRGCGGPERTDCHKLVFGQGVMVLNKLIFNSFYCGRVCSLE